MKIVIPGGTGHLGTALTGSLRRAGHSVVILSRNVESPGLFWDGRTLGDWAETIDGADVVINLAGRSVDCRYGPRQRQEILRSRVDSTRVIGEAIARAADPPRLWLQASTATIYAHRYDAPNDERRGIIGGTEEDVPEEWNFSVEVARAWEKALDDAPAPHTRKVKMRTAIVMSPARGGAFQTMLRHVRLGFGRFGDGRQFMSWIHERDFLRAVDWLIDARSRGWCRSTSPRRSPLPNADFTRILAEEWGARQTDPDAGVDGGSRGLAACGPSRSSCSRAAASCPSGCSSRDSRSSFHEWTRSGARPLRADARGGRRAGLVIP